MTAAKYRMAIFTLEYKTEEPGNDFERIYSHIVQHQFASWSRVLISLLVILSACILFAWLSPTFARLLPDGWNQMQANSAICLLFSAIVLRQYIDNFKHVSKAICTCMSIVVFLLSCSALLEHILNINNFLSNIFVAEPNPNFTSGMSLESAIFLALQGAVLLSINSNHKLVSMLADALIVLMTLMVLILTSVFLYEARVLLTPGYELPIAPHTLIALFCLILPNVTYRDKSNFFFILFEDGIGGTLVRRTSLFMLVIPFIVVIVSNTLGQNNLLTLAYASAVISSVTAILLLLLLIFTGIKVNRMEGELRTLSLTDEMTGLHNMRSFFMIGNQMFDMSNREGFTLEVAYIDLNGLKQINDTLGHETGSELITDFSDLMKSVLSKSDMTARLGGDEFAILSKRKGLQIAINRLEKHAARFNKESGKPFNISFSSGRAEHRLEPEIANFEALVDLADKRMYEAKERHKSGKATNKTDEVDDVEATEKKGTSDTIESHI